MDQDSLELERSLRNIESQTKKIIALNENNSRLLVGREKLNRERIAFMTDFTHEIKSPLTVVQQTLEICEEFAKDKDEKKTIKQAKSSLKRIKNLVHNIMEWSKITMTEGAIATNSVNLVKLTKRIISNVILADHNRHNINFIHKKDKFFVMGDEKYLELAIKNIIENACKYSPENKDISVNIFKEYHQIKISVIDEGDGFPEKETNMLFERFYRTEKARKENAEGTGLGLAMTREILEHHHGDIIAHSRIGKGSEFIITLPDLEK